MPFFAEKRHFKNFFENKIKNLKNIKKTLDLKKVKWYYR